MFVVVHNVLGTVYIMHSWLVLTSTWCKQVIIQTMSMQWIVFLILSSTCILSLCWIILGIRKILRIWEYLCEKMHQEIQCMWCVTYFKYETFLWFLLFFSWRNGMFLIYRERIQLWPLINWSFYLHHTFCIFSCFC